MHIITEGIIQVKQSHNQNIELYTVKIENYKHHTGPCDVELILKNE